MPRRHRMPPTSSTDMRLKKNIGKTRFFFIDATRTASDAVVIAGAGSAAASARTA
jgi:hypothetical protein